jgi:ferrous iron transport protein B
LRTAPGAGAAAEPSPEVEGALTEARAQIEAETGLAVDEAFRRGRSQSASRLAQSVIMRHAPNLSWRDRLDEVLLHPRLGYLALLLSLLLLFEFVFLVGSALEGPLLAVFEAVVAGIAPIVPPSTLLGAVVGGAIQGIAGGLAIVLPYLVPFLLGLSFLEDVGYLPRVAFLMDSLMRRLGLDGKAIVPFILGYGCTVPAVMSTRIMEDSRQRSLAAALTTLLPCAARLSIVFGLVAFHLGPGLALAIFLADLVLVAAIARAVSYLLSQDQPGLILEMPAYRIPSWRGLTAKLFVRLRDFVLHAWPVLIIGSMVLAALVFFGLDDFFNLLVRPFTWVLGLPAATGVPLIFGVLRKELSLVMLGQALGSPDFSAALTPTQMLTFTTFVVLYLPCLATLSVLHREFGRRQMLVISMLSVALALACAIVVRLASSLLYV